MLYEMINTLDYGNQIYNCVRSIMIYITILNDCEIVLYACVYVRSYIRTYIDHVHKIKHVLTATHMEKSSLYS